jgi:ATP-dependent Clp protease ATP-binding subunit ClpC
MTSNVGADTIKNGQGFGFTVPKDNDVTTQQNYLDIHKNVMDQLRRAFRPEFLNRVDASIVFRPLSQNEIKQIVDLELAKVGERLIEHAISLDLTEEARTWLANKGYDPEYGARPLRRLIQNEIEDRLSDGILSGQFPVASVVRMSVDEEADTLIMENAEEPELESPGV